MALFLAILTGVLAVEIPLDFELPGAGFIFLLWFLLAGIWGCSWWKESKERGNSYLSSTSIVLWCFTVLGWNFMFSDNTGEIILGIFLVIIMVIVNYSTIDKNGKLTGQQRLQKLLMNGFLIVMIISAVIVFILPLFNKKKK